jgi:hypothetical protein
MALDTRTWTFTAVDTFTDKINVSESVTGIVGFQATGTCNVVLRAEATINGSTWVTVLLVEGNTTTAATTITVSGSPADKLFRVDAGGYGYVRVYVQTFTSGSCVLRAVTAIG